MWNVFNEKSCFLWMVAVAILLATALRSWRLDGGRFESDEAYSWQLAQYAPCEIVGCASRDCHPPLFHLALKAWFCIFGDSVRSARGFSALLGVICVPLVAATFLEACATFHPSLQKDVWKAAVFVAVLFALHRTDLIAGRTARMYSVGMTLALLSSLFLLRAIRLGRLSSWTAYGFSIAAFCYTHYFAFFSVAAQIAFLIFTAIGQFRESSTRSAVKLLTGGMFATAIAATLFAPWIAIFLGQASTVRQNYWIPPLSASELTSAFATWISGQTCRMETENWFWLLIGGFAVAISFVFGDRAVKFFLLQAFVPWSLAVGISGLSGRSIFVPRYLAFAHPFFLMFLGWLWLKTPNWSGRVFLSVFFLAPVAMGSADYLRRIEVRPSGAEVAALYVAEQRQPNDLLIAVRSALVFEMRCYLASAGVRDLRIARTGTLDCNVHEGHETAVSGNDFVGLDQSIQAGRIWYVADAPHGDAVSLARAFRTRLDRTFTDGGGGQLRLMLFEPE